MPEHGEDAGKVQTHRRALCAWEDFAGRSGAGGLPGVRFAGRRMPVSRDGGDFAGGGGGARPDADAFRARALGPARWLDMARRTATALLRLRSWAYDARYRDGKRDRKRDGAACGVWRLDEPAAARSGDCACGGLARGRRSRTGAGSTAACHALVDALPNGPRNHPDRAGVSGGRRAGSDAASAARGIAEYQGADGIRRDAGRDARLVGAIRNGVSVPRSELRELDGVDADDVIMSPDAARTRGLDVDGLLPAWQPGAGGLGGEEHVHRSAAWSTTMAFTGCAGRPSIPHRARRDGRDQEAADQGRRRAAF